MTLAVDRAVKPQHKQNKTNKTNLVWTKFGYVNGTKNLFPKSGPKRDLLMCNDHSPRESGPVPNQDM